MSEPEREERDFPITFPDGSVKSLSDWAGAPLLLVDVASKCGFTPQYGSGTVVRRYEPTDTPESIGADL